MISGITSSSYSTASAYIADVTPADERAGKFGLLGAAFGLGFIIGPAVGGVLGDIDLRLPFWVAGGLSLANAAYGYFILPESLPPERRARVPWHMANPLGSLSFLRAHPELLALGATYFLYYFAHEVYPTLFVLYGDVRYSWSASQLGVTLALFGVGSMIASAFLIGPIVKRIGERNALLLGLSLGATSAALVSLAYTGMLFYFTHPDRRAGRAHVAVAHGDRVAAGERVGAGEAAGRARKSAGDRDDGRADRAFADFRGRDTARAQLRRRAVRIRRARDIAGAAARRARDARARPRQRN